MTPLDLYVAALISATCERDAMNGSCSVPSSVVEDARAIGAEVCKVVGHDWDEYRVCVRCGAQGVR